MCISNETAISAARHFKNFYHKFGIGHFVLFSGYILFITFAAGLFYIFESAASRRIHSQWLNQVQKSRSRFISDDLVPQIFNNTRLFVFIHDEKSQDLKRILDKQLNAYEKILRLRPPAPILPCTYINSLIFVCSTITTIGYGYIYPITEAGRYLSIFCALFGIPFTLIIIKDLSYLTALLFRYPCACFVYIWHIFRYCTLQPVDENELIRSIHGSDAIPRSDYRLRMMDHLLNIPIMVALMAMIGWTTLGCFMAQLYLGQPDTLLLFYFIFNSLTTIGVGDVEMIKNLTWNFEAIYSSFTSANPYLLLLFFGYLMIGLSIVSLFINHLHAKLSRAYWLPTRLYMPLPTKMSQHSHGYDIESFDSYDNINFISDCPLNHYVTLGVLQSEDKCPLINVIQKERGYVDACTQANLSGDMWCPKRNRTPEALLINKPFTSRDDVNDLMIETYEKR